MTEIHKIVNDALERSKASFLLYKDTSAEDRAQFLDTVADEIMNLGDTLIEAAMEETHLPQARFVGERGRTCNQLRSFATLLREGSWVRATIETAEPQRTPVPKPDMRKMHKAIRQVEIQHQL
jgi:2,5-dioxopentanoate dehydrogenase